MKTWSVKRKSWVIEVLFVSTGLKQWQKDTTQLLIFITGVNDNFEITEEFVAMASIKGWTRGVDLYDRLSGIIERLKLPWCKLGNITTDGSPNLIGKSVHQEALCKFVLQLDHVVKLVVKLINFKRARTSVHHQFIKLLEETDADHQDLLYYANVRWLSLGKVCQRMWERSSFLEFDARNAKH